MNSVVLVGEAIDGRAYTCVYSVTGNLQHQDFTDFAGILGQDGMDGNLAGQI